MASASKVALCNSRSRSSPRPIPLPIDLSRTKRKSSASGCSGPESPGTDSTNLGSVAATVGGACPGGDPPSGSGLLRAGSTLRQPLPAKNCTVRSNFVAGEARPWSGGAGSAWPAGGLPSPPAESQRMFPERPPQEALGLFSVSSVVKKDRGRCRCQPFASSERFLHSKASLYHGTPEPLY